AEKSRLEDEKNRTKAIIESMIDGVVLVNLQGEVILINQAARKMLRLSRREDRLTVKALEESLIGTNYDVTRGLSRSFTSAVALQEEIRVFDRMLALNISPVFDSEGIQIGTFVLMRDVTDEKTQEDRRNEFLSVISHELRTPLASIRGSLDLVFKEVLGPLGEKQRRYLELARTSCEKLNTVIGDLLDLSKFEKGRMEIKLGPVLLNRIVDEVVERFQPYAMEKGASIRFSHPDAEAQVYGDGNRLIQVLNNLISNGVKYTPPGGRIEVELFVPAIMPPQVGVSVKDNGPGIRQEDIDRIFDKYTQPYASAGPGGTGLGLAISRSIIEAHRGKIWAESTPGKGAKFIFILPVEKRSGQPPEVYAELTNIGRREELDGLVVSADESAAYALKGILMERRFRVVIAPTVEDAQASLRERIPHLIVADLDSENIDERFIDFLEHDAETERVPILVFSQYPARIRPRANIMTGTKPIDAHQFLQLLPEALMKMYGGEQKKCVLVVDDDANLRMICREALEFEHYRVLEAASGREAFEHLRRFTPDLILLDLMLPDRSGFEVAQTLKADILLSRIPIVFLTARGQTEDKVRALRAGGADYLVKPFDTTELGARIESILRRAEEELHASPTTKLPGSAAIEKEINRLLSLQKKFALCYLDVDHLKSYNDTYGYAKADGVVRQTGDIIRDTILRSGNPGDFAGHVAGDDFIFITSPEKADELCGQIIAQFDAIIPFYYRREDRERGYIENEDRYGEWRKFPLMSISIACLTNEERDLTDHIQIATLAAEYKRQAKMIRGSSFVKNGINQVGDQIPPDEPSKDYEENV
ncbi:MAG TPA: response regulator, partial [Acidobacteriota bacterium]|nr:response regulator [Acidobacteriota bacterium]